MNKRLVFSTVSEMVRVPSDVVVGTEALDDTINSHIILAAKAADVRADNGKIAGAFVMKGSLISKGMAKAGFCAIINDQFTIGVARTTPLLEQALEEDGYFFRQYPLVVDGRIVGNKPKGASVRKALTLIGGKVRMVISRDRLTFSEFSQALIGAGARDAIYLVGSASSYGFYVDKNGRKNKFGVKPSPQSTRQYNYIVWE